MSDWTPDDVLAAVREMLDDTECWARDDIHPVGAVTRDQELVVVFRWRRNPHLFAFPVAMDDIAVSPWIGEPVKSAKEWAADLGGLIGEELLTGYVASATRVLVDGRIELREPGWPWDDRFDVPEVETDGQVAWLEKAGLDVAVPLGLRAQGRLLGWHATYRDSHVGLPCVGQAATAWRDAATASLVQLEMAPDLPVTAALDLVRVAVCHAADSGATAFVSDKTVPHGEVLGFRSAADGSLRLDTDLLAQDHAAAAALLSAEVRERQTNDG